MDDPRPLKTSVWTKKKCDVCGSADSETLGVRAYVWPTVNFRFEMKMKDALCRVCGFVFEESVPEEKFLEDYYKDSFTLKSDTADIRPDYDAEKRMAVIRKYLKPGASILEIGANLGHFCEDLIAEGYRAEGCDVLPSDGGAVRREFVSSATRAETSFDAVASYYVLEHIADARGWLAAARGLLNEGGRLILEVPNFRTHPSESLNHEHLLHFTPALLARCIHSCGFSILELNAHEASRNFGFSVVAEKNGAPAELKISADGPADNKAAYAKAAKIMEERKLKSDLLSEHLAALVRESGPRTQVYFWGANEFATSFGAAFSSKTGVKPRLVDNGAQKRGLPHDGFVFPVMGPAFDAADPAPKIFVLCSPNYNWQIASQVEGLGLLNASIVDAIRWQPGAPVSR